MALSRSGWFFTRLQIGVVTLSASVLVPWVLVDKAVGGHTKFQPVGTILGLAGMRAYQENQLHLARFLLANSVRYHFGDLSDDAGYAYFAHWYAGLLYSDGRYAQSLKLEQEAAAINARDFGSDSNSALQAQASVADNLLSLGRYKDSEAWAKAALRSALASHHHGSGVPIAHSAHVLCDVYIDTGRLLEAQRALDICLPLERKIMGEKSGWVMQSRYNQATILAASAHYAEAEKKYVELLALEESIMGGDDRWQESTRVNLALTREKQDKSDSDTQKVCAEAVEKCHLPAEWLRPNFYGYARTTADLCVRQGKLSEAQRLYDLALKMAVKQNGPDHLSILGIRHKMAELMLQQGKTEQAAQMAEEVLSARAEQLGRDNLDTASTIDLLGQIRGEQGRLLEASDLIQEAIAIRNRNLAGSVKPLVGESWRHLKALGIKHICLSPGVGETLK